MSGVVGTPRLKRLSRSATSEEILQIVREDGGVIIEQFLAGNVCDQINQDIEPYLDQTKAGSTHADEFISSFHGSNTKRLTNLVKHSMVFRNNILDDDKVHELANSVFEEDSGTYWMTTAQVIDIGPGNKAQPLHRDLENFLPFVRMGPSGPDVTVNFLIALTDFTEQNGATRVIPQSNHWPDFEDRGEPGMTIPAEMKAGDCLFINGKIVHGGGANKTETERRRGVAFTFQPSYLTPEEAYPFLVDRDLVKTMSPRTQRMIGFRSQYPKGSPGLWQSDYKEIGDFLGL